MHHLQGSPVSNPTLLSKSKQLSHVQAIFIAGSLYTPIRSFEPCFLHPSLSMLKGMSALLWVWVTVCNILVLTKNHAQGS